MVPLGGGDMKGNRQTEKQLRSVRKRAAPSDVVDGYEAIAKARRESERKFRSLVQFIPDAIWTTDKTNALFLSVTI